MRNRTTNESSGQIWHHQHWSFVVENMQPCVKTKDHDPKIYSMTFFRSVTSTSRELFYSPSWRSHGKNHRPIPNFNNPKPPGPSNNENIPGSSKYVKFCLLGRFFGWKGTHFTDLEDPGIRKPWIYTFYLCPLLGTFFGVNKTLCSLKLTSSLALKIPILLEGPRFISFWGPANLQLKVHSLKPTASLPLKNRCWTNEFHSFLSFLGKFVSF